MARFQLDAAASQTRHMAQVEELLKLNEAAYQQQSQEQQAAQAKAATLLKERQNRADEELVILRAIMADRMQEVQNGLSGNRQAYLDQFGERAKVLFLTLCLPISSSML